MRVRECESGSVGVRVCERGCGERLRVHECECVREG